MKKEAMKIVICTIEGLMIEWFGGWDIFITSLFFLMIVDMVVGLIKSVLCKSDKSRNGGLSSHSMFVGGIKKLLILIIIVVANALDNVFFAQSDYIRSAVTCYYIVNEAVSIIENLGICGVPLPPFLMKILDNLSDDSKKGGNIKK